MLLDDGNRIIIPQGNFKFHKEILNIHHVYCSYTSWSPLQSPTAQRCLDVSITPNTSFHDALDESFRMGIEPKNLLEVRKKLL